MTLGQLRKICVTDFPMSRNRVEIMEQLEIVIRRVETVGLKGVFWIDGSFLTKKIQPNDVDIVFCPLPFFADTATPEQQSLLNQLADEWEDPETPKCSYHLRWEFPETDRRHEQKAWNRIYWLNQFGRSEKGTPKGIATIQIGDGAL
jgi:hypothetical protein